MKDEPLHFLSLFASLIKSHHEALYTLLSPRKTLEIHCMAAYDQLFLTIQSQRDDEKESKLLQVDLKWAKSWRTALLDGLLVKLTAYQATNFLILA